MTTRRPWKRPRSPVRGQWYDGDCYEEREDPEDNLNTVLRVATSLHPETVLLMMVFMLMRMIMTTGTRTREDASHQPEAWQPCRGGSLDKTEKSSTVGSTEPTTLAVETAVACARRPASKEGCSPMVVILVALHDNNNSRS